MNSGLYAAFLGMRARQRALDVTANNIANASTTGFKADRLLYKSIEAAEIDRTGAQNLATGAGPVQTPPQQTPIAGQPAGTANAEPNNPIAAALPASQQNRALGVLTSGSTDFSTGPIRQTNRSLDVAINGEGFLVVQTQQGERYTRAGAMTLDASGQLVTPRGDIIVGERGPVTLPPGEVSIGEDGSVSVKGQTIDRLRLVRFDNPRSALAKEGDALFAATGGARPLEATNARIEQGALETSNVNVVSEMAAMMQNSREFESLQRSITMMMNDLGRKVAGEIGRI